MMAWNTYLYIKMEQYLPAMQSAAEHAIVHSLALV